MGISIFISHSHKDKALARRLVDAIEAQLEVPSSQIRCSSLPGYGISIGKAIPAALRKDIEQARVVIGILTPNSLESTYVLYELGASWGLGKSTFPTLAKGTIRSNLPPLLRDTNAAFLSVGSEVRQLLHDVRRQTGLPLKDPNPALLEDRIQQVVKAAKRRAKR